MPPPLRQIEILLVEDNIGDVIALKKAFASTKRRLVATINVVNDGDAALDYLFKSGAYANVHKPDLIILDWNLPKRTGSEVLFVLKRTPVLQAIPIVVLSTSDQIEHIDQAYELQANTYFKKPDTKKHLDELVATLEEYWFSLAALSGSV